MNLGHKISFLSFVSITALASACAVFGGTSQPKTTEQWVIAEAQELAANNYMTPDVMEYVRTLQDYARDKKLPTPDSAPQMWEVMSKTFDDIQGLTTDPELGAFFYSIEADIHAEAKTGKEGAILVEAVERFHHPLTFSDLDGFDAETVKLPICIAFRPYVQEARLDEAYFLAKCREWANDDLTKLWEGAEADFGKQEAVVRRLSEIHMFVAAYAFPGGECLDGNCGRGWRSLAGQVESTCNGEEQCTGNGWKSATPWGDVSTTCNKKKCLSEGWTSKGEDGTWVATCMEGACLDVGWTLGKGDETYTFKCRGGAGATSCDQLGYDVTTPDGFTFACTCGSRGCWMDKGLRCDVP